mmetsp:Transcript_6030/g.12218  ORF Transcript_6030/g.12218 Transcript_6030/m.12218 type:complete len:352 (-) Transcript_6030:288-1343(-)
MKICKFENLKKYLKKGKTKKKFGFKNFFIHRRNSEVFLSWFPEFFEGIGLWSFFLVSSPFFEFKKESPNSKFFEYDSKNFEQENGNPLNPPEILAFLFINFYFIKKKLVTKQSYMNFQPDINGKMRAILVDWLIDVHSKFKLMPKTLHLTISILDRFLDRKSLVRQKLQLLGITAMLLASKHEEMYAPETQDFVYISDKSYTKNDIFKMETLICTTLSYNFSSISSFFFLSGWLKFLNPDKEKIIFSIYCIELTLPDLLIMQFNQKTIAASSILIMLEIFSLNFQNKEKEELKIFLGKFFIDSKKLQECCRNIKSFLILNQNTKKRLTSLKRKFSSKKYREVSNSLFCVTF